ncbi:PD-(D/E)XK nuclease family protein [Acuticoccus sp.]|uniref:PD-(D/E)XK nuclease family protein n=1 Tax=Acuticoccus sp. TaxID=1904378 RepID=UPI003B5278BA
MSGPRAPRVLSVDPSDPFLPTLAARLADGTLWPDGLPDDPLALADATIYLPTRRAARALAEAFLAIASTEAVVLPRIETLGDPADEGLRPDVMGQLESRVVLARLVRAWAARLRTDDDAMRPLHPTSAADAIRLADELAALMDQVETQEADWSELPGLVARADLAEHWHLTTDFLRIATEAWPAHLRDRGRITPAAGRRADAEAAGASVGAARGPIVVAGSTGSIPATRRLMATIAASPWGVVVLPGFDRTADAASWEALAGATDAPGHPQRGMAQLVAALGLAPHDVGRLAPVDGRGAHERARVFAAALRPAQGTARWRDDRAALADVAEALDGITLVEASDEREEAAAIAVAMRRSVALGETVALVTPHRALARRVAHELRRWGIEVDDSAGEPLATTPSGTLARLLATCAYGGGAADWLALLKHAGAQGIDPAGVREVERRLRGPRVAPHRILAVIGDAGPAAARVAGRVAGAMAPLTALAGREATVGDFASAHVAAFEALASPALEARDALLIALGELVGRDELALSARDWPSTFEALIAGVPVRGPPREDAVRILGPLEARLQTFDHAVLGGLNEGTWPASPDAGPFLSRPMMGAFGIDLPERRIGLSAHDFLAAAHQRRATLTRARRAGGDPTVASRWWQRLVAFAGADARPALARGAELLALAALRDARPAQVPPARPCPTPPVEARPTSFSVTEVARLVRDPYAVYAHRILGLTPLEALEQEADAADRGEVVHRILARFVREGHHRAADAEARLVVIVEEELRTLKDAPDARALWGARLVHAAPAIVAEEAARPPADASLVEVAAVADLLGVTLRGRIDRLDLRAGGVEVVDYKTGALPSRKEVTTFFEPQLPLEAALVRAGAVPGVPADVALTGLAYVAVAAGHEPVGRKTVAGDDAVELAFEARQRLEALAALYAKPSKGYLSRARPKYAERWDGDYDHLARVAEWGA